MATTERAVPPDLEVIDRLLRTAMGRDEGRVPIALKLLGADVELQDRAAVARAVIARGRELLRDMAVGGPDDGEDEDIAPLDADYFRTSRL